MSSYQNAIIVLNHKLVEEQIEDLRENWGVQNIIYPPQELLRRWGNIPPEADLEGVRVHIHPIVQFIMQYPPQDTLIIVGGETTALSILLQKFWVYTFLAATTRREVREIKEPDGTVKTLRTFRHVRFRRLATAHPFL